MRLRYPGTLPNACPMDNTLRNIVFFIALMATILALGSALAHAYELPRKISLSRDAYFTVQSIYAGWDRLAFVLLIQLSALLTLAWLSRQEPSVLWPVIVALVGLIAAQIVFWIWTFPANKATQNWTTIPENWETLRRNWEYSHLAGAIFQLICAAALVIALLSRRSAPHHGEIEIHGPGPVETS
jgi:hypothetical protein